MLIAQLRIFIYFPEKKIFEKKIIKKSSSIEKKKNKKLFQKTIC